MKRNLKDLTNFAIGATDGEIGKVKDFFFDDTTWTVRYLVVETGGWLSGRRVLLAPQAIQSTNDDEQLFIVNLTKEQVQHSPDINTDNPVSRQQEAELYRHYPWNNYWGVGGDLWSGGMGMGTSGMMLPVSEPLDQAIHHAAENEAAKKIDSTNPHLFSADYIDGYTIRATDGDIGDVEDLIVDDSTWKVDYMVVDTGNWLPGKKVLLSPQQIKEISWDGGSVIVNATQEQVKNSPEYDHDHPLTDNYTTDLDTHYNPKD